MIKMLTAMTHEVDDAALAVNDLLEQLDLDHNLLANSAGVVSCYAEFMETGVLGEICARFPFDVVGCTTLGNGTETESGTTSLCISVLTSDDVRFSAVFTDPITGADLGPIASAYEAGKAALPEEPAMMLAYVPLIPDMGAQRLLDEISRVSGGVPTFGTIACDQNLLFQKALTTVNGESSADRLAMLLLSGPVNARYVVAVIPDDKVQKQKAIITKSDGNVIHEVNNMPILEYMDSLGLTRDNGLEGTTSIPFMVDYGDGTKPVARAIYLVQEDGSVSCAGLMPTGATLAIGSLDYEDVLATAETTLQSIVDEGSANGMLLYPCMGRNMVLGADIYAELDKIRQIVDGKIPYQVCYSGGEICPIYYDNGGTDNRLHNFSLVVCVF